MTTNYERINLLIDSGKRPNASESNTNFSVALTNGYQVKMARLKTICIPQTFYNITSALGNNTLSYLVGISMKVIIIPDGYYTPTTLQAAINTVGATLLTTFTTTFNADNGTFHNVFGASASYPFLTSLLQIMGFTETDLSNVTGGTSCQGSLVCTLINSNYLKLSIDYLSSTTMNIDNKQSNMTFLVEIPLTSFGSQILLHNFNDDSGGKNIVYGTPVSLQSFKVILTDRSDVILDLHSVDWWVMIELIVVTTSNDYYQPTPQQYVPPPPSTNPSYLLNSSPTATAKPTPQFLWL